MLVVLGGELEALSLHLLLKVHDLHLQLPAALLLRLQSVRQRLVVGLQGDLEEGGGVWCGQEEAAQY